jgi:hypothetical protein
MAIPNEPERLPSARCPTVRSGEARSRSLYVRAYSPRTRSPDASRLPSSRNERPVRATPRLLGSPRGSPRRSRRRCFSPTSATDLTTRAPVVPFDSRARGVSRSDRNPRKTTDAEAPMANGDATSNHLAAIRPQVGTRLTARAQLQPPRSQLASRRKRARRRRAAPPSPRRFQPRARLAIMASDAPCRASRSARRRATRRTRAASTALSSNEGGFPGSERLPSTSAPGSPLSRTRQEPATDLLALPPKSRLPTRFRLPDALAPGG